MSKATGPQGTEASSQMQVRGVEQTARTAEAGWHESRYNIVAQISWSRTVAIYSACRRICAEHTPLELFLKDVLDEIPETHPIVTRLSKRGVIANFDEREALLAQRRIDSATAPGGDV